MAGFLVWLPIHLCLPLFIHTTKIYCAKTWEFSGVGQRKTLPPWSLQSSGSGLWWERTQILNKWLHRQTNNYRVMKKKPRKLWEYMNWPLIVCILGMKMWSVGRWISRKSFLPSSEIWRIYDELTGKVGVEVVSICQNAETGMFWYIWGTKIRLWLEQTDLARERYWMWLERMVVTILSFGLYRRSNGKPFVYFLHGT